MKKNIIVLFLMQILVMGIIGSFPGHAQATLNQVGLVVQFGDGRVETECIEFEEESITGYQVLERSGFEFTPSFYSGQGWAICKIEEDGCPANDCFCDPNVFWSYWSLDDGAWLYSSLGASNFHVHNRDVQGWRWGEGVAPEQVYTMEQICVQQATPTNVPTTVSVPAVFGETDTSTPPFTNTPVPSATTTQKPATTQTPTVTYTPSATMIPSMTSTASMTQMAAMSSEETVTPTGEVTETVLPEATGSQEVSPASVQPQKQVTDTPHPKKGFRKSDGTAVVFVEDTTAEAPDDSDEKSTGAAVSKMALLTGGLIGYLVFIVLVGGLGIGLIALLIARRK